MAPRPGSKKNTVVPTVPSVDPLPAHVSPQWAQEGDAITTKTGVRVADTDNSLRAGSRGPALLEDFHLREKIMHFDHERIPERVVHARGAGAHGRFQVYDSLSNVTSAGFLGDPSRETPVFVRFSTVAGSRGSMDTARDVRGFAVKFYTDEGNFDLVGNNIPVFFIQDGIKFPDVVHAVKPEPDREIPQAQSAHDTFWDFVGLQPESTHMLMWVMSDRAIPRSYRTMEGFGVHTFRWVNAAGETSLVKFHWKPLAGVHSLVWEEAQKLGGIDPDFHRRDLWDAIEAGAFPEWELGIQVMPDSEDQTFEGIDLLDPTKIVPEELAPVQRVGKLTLDRNPTNFFAETEQIAFHAGHLVPGIDITDDPLLHARLFSYLDTQLTRLGGPNFDQIPINRPHAPVNHNQRDGFSQQAIPEGKVAYSPNSLSGGCPFAAGAAGGGFVHVPRQVNGPKVRERGTGDAEVGRLISFDDHYTQATLFWNSMSEPEQDHIVGAFSFELGKCEHDIVVDRMLGNLANIDPELVAKVAAHLGKPVPAPTIEVPSLEDPPVSMALTQIAPKAGPITGRLVAVLVADGVDVGGVDAITAALVAGGAQVKVVAPHKGAITGSKKGDTVAADKTFHDTQSVEFDAVVVAGGKSTDFLLAAHHANLFVQEAFRHHKPIAAWGRGSELLTAVGIPEGAAGVVVGTKPGAGFVKSFVSAIGWHRHWDRLPL